MNLKNNILSLIKTVIFATAIIISGYIILAKASRYFTNYDNKTSPVSITNNTSYVFYTQANSDVKLFPYNYADNAMTYPEYYAKYHSSQKYDESLASVVDTINLYDYLRYYFYRTIPTDSREYMTNNDISLASVMDFNNIARYTTVSFSNNGNAYFYYKGEITVKNDSYNLDFSFDDKGYLYSFQCQLITGENLYTDDVMDKGNNVLSNLVADSNLDSFVLLANDIIFLTGNLKNYFLTSAGNDEIIINRNSDVVNHSIQTDIDIFSSDKTYESYEEKFDNDFLEIYENSENNLYSTDSDSKYLTNESQNSYQIVRTKTEYLLILSDTNIVFHYDPLLHVFNGFNMSEFY